MMNSRKEFTFYFLSSRSCPIPTHFRTSLLLNAFLKSSLGGSHDIAPIMSRLTLNRPLESLTAKHKKLYC